MEPCVDTWIIYSETHPEFIVYCPESMGQTDHFSLPKMWYEVENCDNN